MFEKSILQYVCHNLQSAFSDTLRNKHFSPVIKQPFTYYKTETRYLVLRLKPLRERTEDIPGIATLYISQINNELGKQIVGFEPEAMALMKQYSWRENLSQFKRIIRELVLQTESYYIPTHLVQHLLKQEQPAHPHSGSGDPETLNLNQTLDLINYDIVRIVLEQENGNRSRAASRLGISRSTLWRLLLQ